MRARAACFPIHLDLRGRRCVVVGLGAVGMRRARRLIASGASVVGIDPRAAALALPPEITHVAAPYRREYLHGAHLVFAGATADVNRVVAADARELGIWVNCASEPALGDFSVPAIWQDGDVTLSVSTYGASPVLARSLRDHAARALRAGPELAAIIRRARDEIRRHFADRGQRAQAIASLDVPQLMEQAAREGVDAVRADVQARLDEAFRKHGTSPS